MRVSRAFFRILFVLLSILFLTLYTTHSGEEFTWGRFWAGIGIGAGYGLILVGLDLVFRRFNLRTFAIAVVGLFVGYLMGLALVLILDAIVDISNLGLHPEVEEIVKIALFLFGTYLGVIFTLRSSDQLYVSIPFVKFSALKPKTRDLILDTSVLGDTRLVDLARTGLVDNRLLLPRFIVRDLYTLSEHSDERIGKRARTSLELIKELQEMPSLGMRTQETDFPDVPDATHKLVRLARLVDGDILTSSVDRMRDDEIEGVRVINMHGLSSSLQPLKEAGETLTIKIQRPGKEPNQGVGYLEDGTMVVVNGGGDFIGQEVRTRVLSVKHTAAGRMIFCNLDDSCQ